MQKIQLKKFASTRIKKGYPLVQLEDLEKNESLIEGEWATFYSEQQHQLGQGYIGKQNKGIGWILSQAENVEFDQAFFEELFVTSLKARRSFLTHLKETNAFRLLNGEGDGLGGVIIDYYAGYAVFSWYNLGIYQHRELIYQAFQAACLNLKVDIKGTYAKLRFPTKEPISSWVAGQVAPEPLVILENKIKYVTELNEGLMTGIFLDQRLVRKALKEQYAAGKSLLNTFSYTGAFSVAAAVGGAKLTESVDLAKRSLPKTQAQFEVNQLPLAQQKIRVMDVFDYFKWAQKKELTFDIVLADPPSFARSKKNTFSVNKDYQWLAEQCIQLTAKKGKVIFSTNSANLTVKKFKVQIEAAFKTAKRKYQVLETYHLPADFKINPNFKEGNYLKVLVIQCD